eukprot:2495158-Rhodomonas_salina.3
MSGTGIGYAAARPLCPSRYWHTALRGTVRVCCYGVSGTESGCVVLPGGKEVKVEVTGESVESDKLVIRY